MLNLRHLVSFCNPLQIEHIYSLCTQMVTYYSTYYSFRLRIQSGIIFLDFVFFLLPDDDLKKIETGTYLHTLLRVLQALFF